MSGRTPQELADIGAALDLIAAKYCDSSYEELLYAQAEIADLDASQQSHPHVKGCLEGMAEHLREAAFNFYASFK